MERKEKKTSMNDGGLSKDLNMWEALLWTEGLFAHVTVGHKEQSSIYLSFMWGPGQSFTCPLQSDLASLGWMSLRSGVK